MLAVRWHARGDVRVDEVPDVGDPPAGWVRVRVLACGVCGTDVEEYVDGPTVLPVQPHPLTGACAPLTLGHETVGVVEAAGPGVSLVSGTTVVVEGTISCGSCRWCREGAASLCPEVAWLGLRAHGGLAELVLAPAATCVPVPEVADPTLLALAEPLSVVLRGLRRAGLGPDASVGLVGCGTLGLLAVQAARAHDARLVVAVDPLARRRELADRLGAGSVCAPEDAVAVGEELTRGAGLDVVVEMTGAPGGVTTAVALTRPAGATVLLGIFPRVPVPVDLTEVVLGERRLVGSLSHDVGDVREAVALLVSGAVDPAPLVTARVPLEQAVTHALDALVARPQEHLKVLVVPGG